MFDSCYGKALLIASRQRADALASAIDAQVDEIMCKVGHVRGSWWVGSSQKPTALETYRSGKNILDTRKHKYNGHEKVHVSYVQKRVGQHATNVFHWPALLVTSHSKLSIQQIYVFLNQYKH